MILKIYNFYKEGFLSMTIGRKLWLIIGVKIIFLFLILKLFFFQDFLSTKGKTEKEKGAYVLEQLTNINNKQDGKH